MVCNIGDMLQRLTNHRAAVDHPPGGQSGSGAPRLPRYSTPFFLHFNPDYQIRTLPGCVTAEHPDRGPPPITADEFLNERLREIKLL